MYIYQDQGCQITTICSRNTERNVLQGRMTESVYTDGSKIKEVRVESEVYRHLLSYHSPVGRHNVNFDEETEAINLALKQLFLHLDDFQNAHSSSHFKKINSLPSSQKHKRITKIPKDPWKKYSAPMDHAGVEGNDTADKLAKKWFRSSYKQKIT